MCTLCEEKQKYSGRERVERNGLWKNGNEPTNKTTEKKRKFIVIVVCALGLLAYIYDIRIVRIYTKCMVCVCAHNDDAHCEQNDIYVHSHVRAKGWIWTLCDRFFLLLTFFEEFSIPFLMCAHKTTYTTYREWFHGKKGIVQTFDCFLF